MSLPSASEMKRVCYANFDPLRLLAYSSSTLHHFQPEHIELFMCNYYVFAYAQVDGNGIVLSNETHNIEL